VTTTSANGCRSPRNPTAPATGDGNIGETQTTATNADGSVVNTVSDFPDVGKSDPPSRVDWAPRGWYWRRGGHRRVGDELPRDEIVGLPSEQQADACPNISISR
jgi:hypothetical protein